jgi:hypothetical protein
MNYSKKQQIIIFCIAAIFTISCKKEYLDNPDESNKNSTKALLEISYKITTTRDFEINAAKMSNLDLSALNPSNEKQEIKMELFESGQLDITIEELDFSEKIRIPHETMPDKSPKIVKTVISGNIIKFYDANSKLLNTENIQISNHSDLVKTIKDIGKDYTPEEINDVITTMQGHQFTDNLEAFIKDIEEDNNYLQKSSESSASIVKQDDRYVLVRMPLNNTETASNEESFLVLDKKSNKIVGNRIYIDDELIQTTTYGYDEGAVKSLKSVHTTEKVKLISGNETDMTTISNIEDMKFNINL